MRTDSGTETNAPLSPLTFAPLKGFSIITLFHKAALKSNTSPTVQSRKGCKGLLSRPSLAHVLRALQGFPASHLDAWWLPSRQIDSTKARMSSTRHAVVLDPSLTGFGYLPDLIPFHHEERLTGIMGGMLAFWLPIIWGRRKKPVSGR